MSIEVPALRAQCLLGRNFVGYWAIAGWPVAKRCGPDRVVLSFQTITQDSLKGFQCFDKTASNDKVVNQNKIKVISAVYTGRKRRR